MYLKRMYLKDIVIKEITADDDEKPVLIMRSSLEEFNAVKQGTVYFDTATDHLYLLFKPKYPPILFWK